MLDKAKELLLKALDDLDLVKCHLTNERQHDNVGYHLALAVEKTLKAICVISGIDYPTDGRAGHQLEKLFYLLRTNGASNLAEKYAQLIELEIYDSQSRYYYTSADERLDLSMCFARAQDFIADILGRLQQRGYF